MQVHDLHCCSYSKLTAKLSLHRHRYDCCNAGLINKLITIFRFSHELSTSSSIDCSSTSKYAIKATVVIDIDSTHNRSQTVMNRCLLSVRSSFSITTTTSADWCVYLPPEGVTQQSILLSLGHREIPIPPPFAISIRQHK